MDFPRLRAPSWETNFQFHVRISAQGLYAGRDPETADSADIDICIRFYYIADIARLRIPGGNAIAKFVKFNRAGHDAPIFRRPHPNVGYLGEGSF